MGWLKPPTSNAPTHQAELESLAQTKEALHQSCDFVGDPGNSEGVWSAVFFCQIIGIALQKMRKGTNKK